MYKNGGLLPLLLGKHRPTWGEQVLANPMNIWRFKLRTTPDADENDTGIASLPNWTWLAQLYQHFSIMLEKTSFHYQAIS